MREALIQALTFHDLKRGRGSVRQLRAYRELEWRRCKADPIYFLANYGWIKAKSGEIVKWVLWPVQIKLLQDLIAGLSIIAVKARQLGVTTLTTHYFLWKVLFEDAAQCHLVSDSEDKAKEALARVRITIDRLPEWMKERGRRGGKLEVNEDRKDRQHSRKSITFGYSEFTIRTSTPNSVAGLTGVIALDEFSRHREQTQVYDNAIPAVDGGGQLIIIANGQGEDEFFRLYQAAKRGDNGLKPYFFWWGDDPTRDEEWYEVTKKKYLRDNKDKDAWSFKAQYPSNENEAFYISGDSRFDLTKLNTYNFLLSKHPTPQRGYMVEDSKGLRFHSNAKIGNMRLFEKPVKGASYVIGVDPAGGSAASDYSVIQVCRLYLNDAKAIDEVMRKYGYDDPPLMDGQVPFEFVKTNAILEQVAVYQARTEPSSTALHALRLGNWYNEALVVVEANQHGGTVIDRMKFDYFNLYREERKEKIADQETERLGFWSSIHSKIPAIDDLAEFLDKAWLLLRDSQTIKELSMYGWQVSSSGKSSLSAPKGMTDDLVSALSFAVVGARSIITVPVSKKPKVYMPWEI